MSSNTRRQIIAVLFDINKICDNASVAKNAKPEREEISKYMETIDLAMNEIIRSLSVYGLIYTYGFTVLSNLITNR